MMQHDHRRDVFCLEPVEQINVARQLVLVQRRERRGLQPRPFDAEAIGVRAELGHPFDVFGITVVMVARDAAVAAVLRGEMRPLIFDVAFHLRRRRGGAPKKAGRKLQDIFALIA